MTIDKVREQIRGLFFDGSSVRSEDGMYHPLAPGTLERFFRLTLALLDVYEHGALHLDDDPPCPNPDCEECAARRTVARILEEM